MKRIPKLPKQVKTTKVVVKKSAPKKMPKK